LTNTIPENKVVDQYWYLYKLCNKGCYIVININFGWLVYGV
jgi:hypothetical protein